MNLSNSRLHKRSTIFIAIASVLAIGAGTAFATSLADGKYESRLGITVPGDKATQVEHSLPPDGSDPPEEASARSIAPPVPDGSTSSSPAFDRIPGHLLSADAPVPVSPELIDVRNAWIASDGKTLTAIYAGAAGNDSTKGRFVIVRQDLAAGQQTMDVVDVPGSGPVTIADAPKGAGIETTAQRGQIGYHGAKGKNGHLDLRTEKADGQ